jgi:3-hydroxyisobutyrate dehydrogenase-like beta-hydroxyacid dehydrogenase
MRIGFLGLGKMGTEIAASLLKSGHDVVVWNRSAANLVKLCGNFMILAAVEAVGEAMTLAEKGGVQRSQLLEVLTGSLFDVPLYRNYGAMLAEQRFVPAGFAAPLGV